MSDKAPGDPLAARLAAADLGEIGEPAVPARAAPEPAVPAEQLKDWQGGALFAGGIIRKLLPAHVQPEWTDDRLRDLGAELANTAHHYGFTFGQVLNHPLARLAVAAFPLAWPFIEPQVKALIAGKPAEKDAGSGAAAPSSTRPAQQAEPGITVIPPLS